ncbi:hypothetical protein Tco_0365616 [Tanacetum coccineum]
MASLDHRLNSLFSIKECSSCGALYTADFCCSKGGLEDKILVPKPPQNCATCGDPVDGLYCRPCAFVRKCLNEGWYTIHDENEILNTSESSNDNTNIVSAPQEPFVFNQDPGVNSSQSLPQINHNCCYECGDSLDGIFCQQCTCKSCGNGAHIGYNCPPKAPIISNPEQCNQTINELPQILPSVHPTCNSGDENSFTHGSKPNSVDDSPNVFNPPPQPSMNSCEFYRNDARYGHYCNRDKETAAKVILHIGIFSMINEAKLETLLKDAYALLEEDYIENLVPIPSEFEGISDDTCNMPVGKDSSTFDALSDHSEILSDSNNDDTLRGDRVDQEKEEFDLEDILQIQDVILREKLVKISRLITNIESLKDNPTPDHVFKSPFSVLISITDSDSFFEKSDTSLSHLDNLLPKI